jgi:hypothetical protein
MTDDEKFFAWLDGELGAAEAVEMEAKVAADPRLARLADQHRKFAGRLKDAFDPIAAAPLPDHVQAALQPLGEVIDFASAKRARSMPPLPQWAAMAATLALGLLLGTMIPQRGTAPVEVQGGKLYAAAALNHALDTQLASSPAGSVRIGLTFRDQAGAICRSFTGPAASGLACRSDGHWQLKGLFAAPEGQSSDYRMAGGVDPNLAGLVDSSIAGEPFDAAAEKAALQKGWR